MLGFLSKKNTRVESEWLPVSKLKIGMQIAVPKRSAADIGRGIEQQIHLPILPNDLAVADDFDSNLAWDEIESIEYVGAEQVWDIEVEGTHNFIGNNIFAHNTYMSGNVGIGTTAPGSILALGGTAARIIQMERNTTTATAGQGLTIYSGGAIAGTANLAGGDLTLKSGTSTGTGTSALHFYTATAAGTGTADNAPTEKMTILGSGNVGIGTTGPQSLLDIQGPVGTGAVGAGILTLATKELTIVDGDQLGRINFNSPLATPGSDSILAGAAIWAEADDTFSTTVNSTELVFGTATTSAAVERMRIDSAGNVGIGTANPLSKFNVEGDIRAGSVVGGNFLAQDSGGGFAGYWSGRRHFRHYAFRG